MVTHPPPALLAGGTFFAMKHPVRLLLGSLLLALTLPLPAATLADFEARAAKTNQVLVLPDYPVTPGAVSARTERVTKAADAALAALVAQPVAGRTFDSTFARFDEIVNETDSAIVR